MLSGARIKMTAPAELFIAVFVTAIVILGTAILVGRHSKRLASRVDQAATSTAPEPKSLTFRVNNIPIDQTADELVLALRSIAEQDPVLREAAATIACRSLASQNNQFGCATVSITTSLPGDKLCDQMHKAGKDQSSKYSYTCKFDGITPLYESRNGADVDVIAVPGLGSHALGSWKSPNSDDVWLRDFLPKNVSNIRVLLYGYDTTLADNWSKQSIEDLGTTFLEQVIAFRARDGTSLRPIIFIGHSLGGLLIKEALVRACNQSNGACFNLSKACFGLLLFGVPNLGLRNGQLMTIVRGQPNESLIRDLVVDTDSEPSAFLKRLGDQFSTCCKGQYQVVTFFERILSPTLKEEDGRWRKTGPRSLLVTTKSATSTGLVAVADEDNIPLNRDHSGLVKYESRNEGEYTVVEARIAKFVYDAKLEVARRFAEHNLCQPQSETTQACLRSLAFRDMDGRVNDIANAADGTCEWLLNHKTLKQWTRQPRGLLWIKGKPGSGKSTLMKYALRALPPIYGTDTRAFSFFFHGRGHELQKTPLGLFRSLLHQLLKHFPGALPDLIDYYEKKRKTEGEPGEKWQWDLQPLQDFLKSSLPRILERFAVILFVDALDECGEKPAREVISHLESLLSSVPPNGSRFGICFSCRQYPILQLRDGLTILLEAEEGHTQDIATFVKSCVSTNRLDVDIGDLVIKSAQGVFMWARLVLEQAVDLSCDGGSPQEVEAAIRRTPQDLNDLYHTLIQGLKEPLRISALNLLRWICFSTRPLTTDELQWAMAIDPDGSHKSLKSCRQSGGFVEKGRIDRRIKALSCGLAEIVPSSGTPVVQFIHQSVKDFFVETGLSVLDNTSTPAIGLAHYQLSKICIRYLATDEIGRLRSYERNNFPFLHYATTSWVAHAKQGDAINVDQKDLLESFCWPSEALLERWIRVYSMLDKYSFDRPVPKTSLVHVLSEYGMANALDVILRKEGHIIINTKDNSGRTPLSRAAGNGHETVVKQLLATGSADVNSKDPRGQTPVSWAAEFGHEAVVKQLLATGSVDVNSKDIGGRIPLSYAAENGHEIIVKQLLATGSVDVNSKDFRGQTPLSLAAKYGHETVIKQLLAIGSVDAHSKDKRGQTPLSWAAKNGHETVVKQLLATGSVDVNSKDFGGRTPLSWAAERGHKAIVKLLEQ